MRQVAILLLTAALLSCHTERRIPETAEARAARDPWYRIGVFESHGRRIALSARDELLSAKTIESAASGDVSASGNLIALTDIDAEFNRRLQPFLNDPWMETIYAKKAALSIIEQTRADFHDAVRQKRDAILRELEAKKRQ